MLIYYVYAYLRSDGTPYYIGKGKKDRAFRKTKCEINPPTDISRLVFLETNLSEVGALALERRMVRWYGRKDLGTGILRNKTDGGDGLAGAIHSEETRRKMSEANKGNGNPFFGKKHSEEFRRKLSEIKKGKKHSEETRKKISETNKARKRKPHSEETLRKIRESNKGKKRSEETRRKMSEIKKGKKRGSYKKHV